MGAVGQGYEDILNFVIRLPGLVADNRIGFPGRAFFACICSLCETVEAEATITGSETRMAMAIDGREYWRAALIDQQTVAALASGPRPPLNNILVCDTPSGTVKSAATR